MMEAAQSGVFKREPVVEDLSESNDTREESGIETQLTEGLESLSVAPPPPASAETPKSPATAEPNSPPPTTTTSQDRNEPSVSTEKAANEAPALAEEPTAPPAPKSWASLFSKNEGGAQAAASTAGLDSNQGRKPMAMIQPYNPKVSPKGGASSGGLPGREGEDEEVSAQDVEFAGFLKAYQLNHRASAIKPRGLSNRSNWCFVNAILQALLACPPFYNLMKSVPKEFVEGGKGILGAVHAFFAEFSPLEHFPKLNSRRRKNGDLPQGKILEPSSIYNYLLNSLSPTDTFKVVEGRQEDAEEFLTFLLNGLNDEMLALLKSVEKEREPSEQAGSHHEQAVEADEDDGDEWQEVGPKNKSVVTRRGGTGNSAGASKPPLAEIFQGQMRSCLQPLNGDPTATLQPFFSLQLDIQSEKVSNVTEAIVNNFATEIIDGYLCPKTKVAVEASKSMTLEELPPILVLHLKRFVYDGSGKGSQKLCKNIDFPVDLEIGPKILSPTTKSKHSTKQRSYKLFAVVYHNGTEASKGHYITDIYHTGLATWIRCDDSILKIMPESLVLAHSANSVPYILFYRRGDTMQGHAPTSVSSSGGSREPGSQGGSSQAGTTAAGINMSSAKQ